MIKHETLHDHYCYKNSSFEEISILLQRQMEIFLKTPSIDKWAMFLQDQEVCLKNQHSRAMFIFFLSPIFKWYHKS